MASLTTDSAGRHRIQFFDAQGNRRSIGLGRMPINDAQAIRNRVKALNTARHNNSSPPDHVVAWLKKIGNKLHKKFSDVELVEPRAGAAGAGTLAVFLDGYIASRTDAKPNTIRNLKQSRRYLVDYFGEARRLRTITAADADKFGFRMQDRQEGYAEATAARVIKHARQFFKHAGRAGLVDFNPFAGVKAGSMENKTRIHIVSREDTEKLIEAAPNAEWRLIIALARYGGLRTPSETLTLTWEDVLWNTNKLRIKSPKLKRTKKYERVIPLFPELRPHLDEAWEVAEQPGGAVPVITRSRDPGVNWRTTFEKIIRKAGLIPWKRLFQNLRATRETELAAEFPIHTVCEWIGNSVTVAAKHYLSTTEADFARASGAELVQPVVQTLADAAESKVTGVDRGKRKASKNVGQSGVVTTSVDSSQVRGIPLTGVEPVF